MTFDEHLFSYLTLKTYDGTDHYLHFICQSANFEVGQSNKLGKGSFNIIQLRQVGKVVGLLDKLVGMFDSQPFGNDPYEVSWYTF